MLQQSLKLHVESVIAKEKAGFHIGRVTMDQLVVIEQLMENYYE